jgi:cation diffusion facilitator CzcD-associated flavoprotein CzcO
MGKEVVIIGAGPSGLVAARHCLARGLSVRVLDAGTAIGNNTAININMCINIDFKYISTVKLTLAATIETLMLTLPLTLTGGSFLNKKYANAHLVSSKYLTAFSDFRWEDEISGHPSLDSYLDYLKRYAEHFDLFKHIEFGVKVLEVGETPDKCLLIEVERRGVRDAFVADSVLNCTGLHQVPLLPEIADIDAFKV